MNPEFQVHMLNDNGIDKAKMIASIFDHALSELKTMLPVCREFSIVRTKMEEACFFAKKAMANVPANQKETD
jgi:hypothetical protein